MLVRHATFITDEVAETPMLSVLVEQLRERDGTLRKAAVAALGELLFYIATQEPGEGAEWNVPTSAYTQVRGACCRCRRCCLDCLQCVGVRVEVLVLLFVFVL